MTATDPFLRIFLKFALVAGTLPIQAVKCRHPLSRTDSMEVGVEGNESQDQNGKSA